MMIHRIHPIVAPDKLSLSPRRHRVTHRSYSPTYIEQPRPKQSYRERYEEEHTYAAQRGGRHFKERARSVYFSS